MQFLFYYLKACELFFQLITKQHGLILLEYIGNVKSETAFDELIQKISEIRLIKLNMEQWMLSSCTCAGWHKYLKCVHIQKVTTQKDPQKKKTRQKKTYIVENTRDTRSKRATVCDNTSTAKRIKY